MPSAEVLSCLAIRYWRVEMKGPRVRNLHLTPISSGQHCAQTLVTARPQGQLISHELLCLRQSTFWLQGLERLVASFSGLQDVAAELALVSDAGVLHGLLSAQQRVTSERAAAQQSPDSLQASLQIVSDGIQAGAALMAQAVQPATAAAQRRHVVELHAWLADRFPACSLHTICPELLAVYLTQHWLPQHAGSQLPASVDRIAAPASLAAMLSHLAHTWSTWRGVWDHTSCCQTTRSKGTRCTAQSSSGFGRATATRCAARASARARPPQSASIRCSRCCSPWSRR